MVHWAAEDRRLLSSTSRHPVMCPLCLPFCCQAPVRRFCARLASLRAAEQCDGHHFGLEVTE